MMAMRKTPAAGPVARFTNRNMPIVLKDKLRILAAQQRRNMEDVANEALAIGLDAIERRLINPSAATS